MPMPRNVTLYRCGEIFFTVPSSKQCSNIFENSIPVRNPLRPLRSERLRDESDQVIANYFTVRRAADIPEPIQAYYAVIRGRRRGIYED